MTAYVSIPVASAKDVIKVPNAALRYKPDLSPERAQELYRQYGMQAQPRAEATRQPNAPVANAARERQTAKPDMPAASETAVVWKLLPDRSLQPVQVHVGLTDHTFTALTGGGLTVGEELVTGAAAAKAGTSGLNVGGGPRR